VESLDDPELVLPEALKYLQRQRRVKEEQKLLAASRRTSGISDAADEIALLKELTESRRQPDLHRA
jgi:hypothetical protein